MRRWAIGLALVAGASTMPSAARAADAGMDAVVRGGRLYDNWYRELRATPPVSRIPCSLGPRARLPQWRRVGVAPRATAGLSGHRRHARHRALPGCRSGRRRGRPRAAGTRLRRGDARRRSAGPGALRQPRPVPHGRRRRCDDAPVEDSGNRARGQLQHGVRRLSRCRWQEGT